MSRNTYLAWTKSAAERAPAGSGGVLRACSACAGNYEDPERTAPARQADEALTEGEEAEGTAWPAAAVEEE